MAISDLDPLDGTARRAEFHRRVLLGDELIVAPGVYDGISALVATEAGFPALYISGGAVARSTGVPDLGILGYPEVAERTRQVVDATALPVIADADTGYGGVHNIRRTVRGFEAIGVAALHIEDQLMPKKCGHYANKAVVDRSEAVARLRTALEARTDENLVIIARTDAIAVNGLADAIDRGKAFRDAGADMVFVEAPESRAEIEKVAESFDCPLVINMFAGGKTPLINAAELAQMGYRLMIVPSDLQRAAVHAMQRAARVLLAEGDTASLAEVMVSFSDREGLVRSADYAELERRYQLEPGEPPRA